MIIDLSAAAGAAPFDVDAATRACLDSLVEPARERSAAVLADHPSGRNQVRTAMEWKSAHFAELAPEQRAMVRFAPATVSSSAR